MTASHPIRAASATHASSHLSFHPMKSGSSVEGRLESDAAIIAPFCVRFSSIAHTLEFGVGFSLRLISNVVPDNLNTFGQVSVDDMVVVRLRAPG